MPLPASEQPITRRLYLGFLWSLAVLLAIHIIGTIGYRIIGGDQYSLVDCFYMTFITIATIGFHEVVDLNGHPGGRIFRPLIIDESIPFSRSTSR